MKKRDLKERSQFQDSADAPACLVLLLSIDKSMVLDMIGHRWAIGIIELFRSTSMSTITHSTKLILFVLFCTAAGISTSYGAGEDDFHAVATYECIGLYFKSPDLGPCEVRFRQDGLSAWREGYPLVYDPRDNEYRGSIIGLQSDTSYSVKITLNGKNLSCAIWMR